MDQENINPAALSQSLAQMIEQAGNVVVFTGAGISTECGIPDFRSPGGIWSENKPIDFAEFMASRQSRQEAWRRKFKLDDEFAGAKPGRGHKAIASLVARGKISYVITQNIDNLHQASGVPDARIIELHGNSTYALCLECATRHELDWVRAEFEPREHPPDCRKCNGILKSATISFGQSMPQAQMARAHEATLQADLFIAIGTSLVVYPAAGFPDLARQHGATLVILNREPTQLDPRADLVIHEDIGSILAPLGI